MNTIQIEKLLIEKRLRKTSNPKAFNNTEGFSQEYYFTIGKNTYQVDNDIESKIESAIKAHLTWHTEIPFQEYEGFVENSMNYGAFFNEDKILLLKNLLNENWTQLTKVVGGNIYFKLPDSLTDCLRDEVKKDFITALDLIFSQNEEDLFQWLHPLYKKEELAFVYKGYTIIRQIEHLKQNLADLISPTNTETEFIYQKDKLSNKQQVLLLHWLGIFNLPEIQNLTEQQRGKLFGYLLNRNEKNTEDYIRYRAWKDADAKYSLYSPKVKSEVIQIINELGLSKPE